MRFETSQSLRLGQSMKLAPRTIQTLAILQMPLAELEERLEQELESNPTLELQEGDPSQSGDGQQGDPADAPARDDASGPASPDGESGQFDRLDDFEHEVPDVVENEYSETRVDRVQAGSPEDFDGLSYRKVRDTGDRDAKLDAMAAAPARGASLLDQLRGQWALADVEASLRPLGDLILSFLEDDGSLKTPLETILDRAPRTPNHPAPTLAQLERALKALQLFLEPAGVAARTPQECLLLQLDALEDEGSEIVGWPAAAFAHARVLVERHLEDLTQNRLPKVAEKTGLSLTQIKDALMLLRRLSLAPGRRLVETTERPLVPDAIVEYDESQDRYIAYLNDLHLPSLRINEEYARLSRDKGMEKRDREFIKTNLSNAQWLLDAVAQRRQTLLRVVMKVVEHQREFFEFGPQALRPLPMTQVADELGIHVATVSRAVAEKYIATPRGVMPLRKFFSGGVTTKAQPGEDGAEGEAGDALAWEAIKAALREVIDSEDKRRPLADEALADELKKRGIEIARRTVAKYRDQLQIPPARLRKQF